MRLPRRRPLARTQETARVYELIEQMAQKRIELDEANEDLKHWVGLAKRALEEGVVSDDRSSR